MPQPSLFVSHGAPDVVLKDSAIKDYLVSMGRGIVENNPPDAIVIVSAHFETPAPQVVTDPAPEMIYDFSGFQPELYEMQYPAPGSPELGRKALDLLADAGLEAMENFSRGYDHGTWTVLKLMFPDADIPVVQVSIQPRADASHHFRLGQALQSLRDENVLIIGSGHITHNLRAAFQAMRSGVIDTEMVKRTEAFTEWMADMLNAREVDPVLDWWNAAPFAADNHPTPEHLFPLFVALGAGGRNAPAERLHTSKQYGFFTSDVWAFG